MDLETCRKSQKITIHNIKNASVLFQTQDTAVNFESLVTLHITFKDIFFMFKMYPSIYIHKFLAYTNFAKLFNNAQNQFFLLYTYINMQLVLACYCREQSSNTPSLDAQFCIRYFGWGKDFCFMGHLVSQVSTEIFVNYIMLLFRGISS